MAPRALSRSLVKVTRPILAKGGTALAELVAAWPQIAGPRLAESTAIDRLALPRGAAAGRGPGILHLRVEPALALELQHVAPQIIERLNAYLGYAAVGRIALAQRPISRLGGVKRRRASLPPDASARAAAEKSAAIIEDPELRAALSRLGSQLLKRRNS